jgi:hypothetical protein
MKHEDVPKELYTVTCPKCGRKAFQAFQEEGVLSGLVETKCHRCKTITAYLLLQDKVYIYNEKLRNNPRKIKKLLNEFKNKLPNEYKIDILKEITETLLGNEKS